MIQVALQVQVNAEEVLRKRSFGAALELCADLGGLCLAKQAAEAAGINDKGQFSRIVAGTEGIKWDKLKRLMLAAGNEVPVLWMAHDAGFDIHSMHKKETEVERQNRMLREEVTALRRVLMGGAALGAKA